MCNEITRQLEEQVSDLEKALSLAKSKINEIIKATRHGSGHQTYIGSHV